MKLSEIAEVLDAKVLHGTEELLDVEIASAAASDLMSDILARVDVPDLLLTGLNNAQIIRTSSVFGIKAVIVVRGKLVDEKVVELAREEGIVVLSTDISLFGSSGRLFAKGVRSSRPAGNRQAT